MARRHLLVWGTCWLEEPVTTLARFLHSSAHAVRALGIEVEQVVFDARHNRTNYERTRLLGIWDAILLSHRIAAYPNKNFGVAMIAAHASKIGADLVAIVDADWAFDNLEDFVHGLLAPVLADGVSGVLPDIGRWAGRSNRLVGVPAMNLLRAGMSKDVPTPFPGAVAAKTDTLSAVTNSPEYHYDWGGEWDIADGLWSSGSVASPKLGMVNVRHRTTASKAGDAFQIWRAVLACSGNTGIAAFDKATAVAAERALGVTGLVDRLRGSATEQLAALAEAPSAPSEIASTVNQLIPMVLAPLAFLVDGTNTLALAFPANDTTSPYNRSKLAILSSLATLAAESALSARRVGLESRLPQSGGPLGTWSTQHVATGRTLIMEQRWT